MHAKLLFPDKRSRFNEHRTDANARLCRHHDKNQMNVQYTTMRACTLNVNVSVIIEPFHQYSRNVNPYTNTIKPGRVAQSVTCLATDACLTADPRVASSIPARSHTFVEIDHEIISTVILLPSADSFKKGCCQLQAKVCAQITG